MKGLVRNLLLFIGLCMSFRTWAQKSLEWKFKHPLKGNWMEAGAYGSVQEKLIQTGELPDPFVGMNEKLFAWIEHHPWEFQSEFSVSFEDLSKDYIELQFPGIDTYAEIFLNGEQIGFAQNAFRPYVFEVKKKLKMGLNKLRVVFYPPVLYHRENYLKAKYKLPAPNDVDSIAIAPYTRKPQYQFGWDWSLRMNTLGFLKPVVISGYNLNRIFSTNIVTDSISDSLAFMTFELQLSHPASRALIWRSERFGDVSIEPGEHRIIRKEVVENPRLWWPRGQGRQELYSDKWVLLAEDQLVDWRTLKFGIRKTELIVAPDKWGTSFEISVNDRSIFCKGGDYIPQDIFPSRVKDADLRNMVAQMVHTNFNMVRVWGGGYYPDEAFFEACDSLGLMVWQDFMFACAMYPGDPDYLSNVKDELEYQIPRIASHPSLTLFNGNNEVDVAWKYWGFQLKYNLFGADAKEIEASYVRLFKQLIPSTLARYTNAPYIHTSPLSHWGKDEFYDHGSQHYWGVWHGKDPMSDFAKKIGRFNAEYGFQSFPEYSTLLTFSEKKDWNLESEVMKHHQKSYVGNGMILKHARLLYGQPANFEEFVYYSQLTQASAVRMAVTGHRLDAPRCMGTLYWQVNDCWPAPSWSSIDYFGNWKALQYWVRDDYEDVAVLSKMSPTGEKVYYLVSDQPDTFQLVMNLSIYNLKGKLWHTEKLVKKIGGPMTELIHLKGVQRNLEKENYVIYFQWNDANGMERNRIFSHLPKLVKKSEAKEVKWELTEVDQLTKTAKVLMTNTKYIRNVWLSSSVFGVEFDRNFVDLLPGKHVFKIKFKEIPTINQIRVKWM